MPKSKDSKKINFKKSIVTLYFLGLLLALASALPTYVHSNFLSEFVSLQTISLYFIIANFITFFLVLTFPKLIKKYKDATVFKTLLVFYTLALFFFSTVSSAWQGLLAIILFTIFNNLLFIKLDLLLEKFILLFIT